ncbi:MAG: MAPEG family protein [Salinisphaeraceae bacterium]|nr:MAPEG family protein [Salinisphaeraceae bacterium]
MFPITTSFAVLILALITLLAINTTRVRFKTPREPTPQQREALRRAIRTHGNNFEHGVTVILLMLFYEVSGGSATVLCGLGLAYLLLRLIYSFGYLTKPASLPQQLGAGGTYLIELVLVLMVLWSVFAKHVA